MVHQGFPIRCMKRVRIHHYSLRGLYQDDSFEHMGICCECCEKAKGEHDSDNAFCIHYIDINLNKLYELQCVLICFSQTASRHYEAGIPFYGR